MPIRARRRYTVEVHMDKVESVDVDQSLLGRMLDYGDVIIHATGATTPHTLRPRM